MLLGGAASLHGLAMADRLGGLAVVVRRLRLARRGLGPRLLPWFRDDPAEHPETNEAERRLIAEGRMPHRSVEGSEETQAAGLAVASVRSTVRSPGSGWSPAPISGS